MGANAQTSVPVFSAGQVLTAQQQKEINTGIPVFATTTTRDAAFGGAGEKVLAEGQFAYIEATNTTQYYDGAAWQTVNVTPGLVCVKAETAFSAVASVTADNIFTSTYTNYVINLRYAMSAAVVANMRLRVASVSAATNYNYQEGGFNGGTAVSSRSTAQTSFVVGNTNSGGTVISSSQITLFSPAVADPTTFQILNSQTAGSTIYTSPIGVLYFGNHSTATAYDGFELLVSSGTITGSYSVYGYSKTV